MSFHINVTKMFQNVKNVFQNPVFLLSLYASRSRYFSMTALRIISFLDDVLIILGCRTSWYFKLSLFFYLLLSKYKLIQFLKNYFPLEKINEKSFIPMAGQLMLLMFVDVDVDVDH